MPPGAFAPQASPLTCPACAVSLSAATMLGPGARYWAEVRAVSFTCPACGAPTAARVQPGRLSLGYVYAAGAAHFAAEAEYRAPEVTGVWTAPDGLHVRLDDAEGEREIIVAP